jgi:hypothetical protein
MKGVRLGVSSDEDVNPNVKVLYKKKKVEEDVVVEEHVEPVEDKVQEKKEEDVNMIIE